MDVKIYRWPFKSAAIKKLINIFFIQTLRWRHNEHDGVLNHQRLDCYFNRLFKRKSKKTSKLRVTGLCERNSPVTGECPAQRSRNAKNVSIWWRHHEKLESSALSFATVIQQAPIHALKMDIYEETLSVYCLHGGGGTWILHGCFVNWLMQSSNKVVLRIKLVQGYMQEETTDQHWRI